MEKRTRTQLTKKLRDWSNVVTALRICGWRVVKDSADEKIFVLRNQRLAVLKFSNKKWKILVYERNRLIDSSFDDEAWAKLHIFEIGLARSFRQL